MAHTNRAVHPECRHCHRTIQTYRVDPFYDGKITQYIHRWIHRKSGKIACGKWAPDKIASPVDSWNTATPSHKGKPTGNSHASPEHWSDQAERWRTRGLK